MGNGTETRLMDRMISAYVDWREECVGVWGAYESWSGAPRLDRPLAFSAYHAALEREEQASRVYAGLLGRLAASGERPCGIAAPVADALRAAGAMSPAVAKLVSSGD